MTNEEFYRAIDKIKDDIAKKVTAEISTIMAKEINAVTDYIKNSYDKRLTAVETKLKILEAKLWPWWVIAALLLIVILALVVAIIK